MKTAMQNVPPQIISQPPVIATQGKPMPKATTRALGHWIAPWGILIALAAVVGTRGRTVEEEIGGDISLILGIVMAVAACKLWKGSVRAWRWIVFVVCYFLVFAVVVVPIALLQYQNQTREPDPGLIIICLIVFLLIPTMIHLVALYFLLSDSPKRWTQSAGGQTMVDPWLISPKSKGTAVLLAVFLGFLTWCYTYKRDAWKFWVNLFLTIVTFGLYFVVAWIWAIIDVSVKPKEFYQHFPHGK